MGSIRIIIVVVFVIIYSSSSPVVALISNNFKNKLGHSVLRPIIVEKQRHAAANHGSLSLRPCRGDAIFLASKSELNSSRDDICNDNDDTVSEISSILNDAAINTRRLFLANISTTATTTCFVLQPAQAIDNPLNLKGTFWETGKLYEKSNTTPDYDEADFLSTLDSTLEALRSPTLLSSITEGKYGSASRLLRGGLISESKIRIAAYALIDSIPEENEVAIYKCNESFRVFLRYLDVLDAEIEVASNPLKLEGDPRIKVLTRLGEAEDALKVFLKNIRGGLSEQQ